MPVSGTSATDASLASALDALSLPGMAIGHRAIALGDENSLMPEEAVAFASSVVSVRRASGAARIVARELLARFGHAGCAIPKGAAGAPIWPSGVVGSLAHDSYLALAAVGLTRNFGALGIDIEPAEALPAELLDLVATPQERTNMDGGPYYGRLLFTAKEAVYKAVYPLDRTFLEHQDVEVDLAGRTATVRNGRVVGLRYCISTHLVALAFLPAAGERVA